MHGNLAAGSTTQLLSDNIVQGGSADQSPNDEMLSAIEAIRERHKKEVLSEEATTQQQLQI